MVGRWRWKHELERGVRILTKGTAIKTFVSKVTAEDLTDWDSLALKSLRWVVTVAASFRFLPEPELCFLSQKGSYHLQKGLTQGEHFHNVLTHLILVTPEGLHLSCVAVAIWGDLLDQHQSMLILGPGLKIPDFPFKAYIDMHVIFPRSASILFITSRSLTAFLQRHSWTLTPPFELSSLSHKHYLVTLSLIWGR